MICVDCPGEESALPGTDGDFTGQNDRTVQVKHHVHLQHRRKMFSVHAQLAASQEFEVAEAIMNHVALSEKAGLALGCPQLTTSH